MKTEKGRIGVDINHVRDILLSTYSELCHYLNNSMQDNQNIIIDPKKIKSTMDLMRECIAIIAATNIEGREDFKSVGSEKELPVLNIPNE